MNQFFSSVLLDVLVFHPGFGDTEMELDIPHGLKVGSMVEVFKVDGDPRYGVIRWIGILPQIKDKLVAGLELVRI